MNSDIGCEYKIVCSSYTGKTEECAPSECNEYQHLKQIQYGHQSQNESSLPYEVKN